LLRADHRFIAIRPAGPSWCMLHFFAFQHKYRQGSGCRARQIYIFYYIDNQQYTNLLGADFYEYKKMARLWKTKG